MGISLMKTLLPSSILFILVQGEQCAAAAATTKRDLEGCATGVEAGEGTLELSGELASQVLKSIDLVQLVESINLVTPEVPVDGSGFETLQSFYDINDVTIVARDGNICYAGFRGTNFANIFDFGQLFFEGQEDFEGCRVRSGALSAYFSDYYDDFRAAVSTCMDSASELVLTGHSQGGAIGLLGSIDLKEYNLKVISFGAVRALVEPCGQIDSTRHFRFVNTRDEAYDFWAAEFTSDDLIHVGHAILLDKDATNRAVYLGLDNDVAYSPSSLVAHDQGPYWESLRHLIPDPFCFPVVIGGWESGHWCTMDLECQSGTCFSQECTDDNIIKLEMGEVCNDDTECQSGVCSLTWWWFTRRCD